MRDDGSNLRTRQADPQPDPHELDRTPGPWRGNRCASLGGHRILIDGRLPVGLLLCNTLTLVVSEVPRGTKGRDTRGSCGPLSQPGFKGTETGGHTPQNEHREGDSWGCRGGWESAPSLYRVFSWDQLWEQGPGKTPLCFKKLKEADGGFPAATEDR